MQRVEQSGSNNIAVQLSGDGNTVTIQAGSTRLALVRRHLRSRPPRKDLDLLDPYRCPIALVGRTGDLASLEAWLQSDLPIAVQCRIGRAGSGKTRLATELCRRAEAQGWTAGFLAHDELTRFQADGHVRGWAWPRPTLVVIDHAATSARPFRQWLEDLADRDAADGPPLRLLLLERHASGGAGWWSELTRFGGSSEASIEDLLDPPEPIELSRISTAEERRALLRAIMSQAAALNGNSTAPALPEPGADPVFDAAIAREAIELEPLYLLMAGVTAVQTNVPHVLAWTRTDLAVRLATRELERIGDLAERRGIDRALAQHLTSMLTLTNGCTIDALLGIVTEEAAILGHPLATGPAPVTKLLVDTLAGHQPVYLDPIRPDLIGEAAILATFQRRTAGWQAAAVSRAYDRAGPETVVTVIRTAQDFAAGALDHPSLLWLDHLVDHVGDPFQLMAIADLFPEQTVNLLERAAALSGRIVDIMRGASAEQPELRAMLATSLNNLGAKLSELGRREDALAAAEEAVAVYCELSAARPDAFKPFLASSLNNLGVMLSELGRREDALAAAEEAVAIRRELLAAGPDAFKPDLAMSLNNLGNRLSELGRREAALAAAEEAVAVYRELAASRPDAFKPDLASSLNNLGNMLSALGRHEAALAATEEAVAIRRELSAAGPDAFKPDLAMSLNNLGNRLSELGRREAALAAAEEAVAVYRELAASRPDAFKPDLASSLNNLGNMLSALGRREAALSAAEEAVATRRELSAARPDAFKPYLAGSLNNLGAMLSALGRHEAALAAAEEAVAVYRELAASRPDAFKPDLASSLNNLGNGLSALGRHEAALSAAEEAVAIRRELSAARPDAFKPDLAMSLNNLGAMLSALGRREAALAAAEEVVAIRRELAAARPDAFLPDLARSLSVRGDALEALDRPDEAVASDHEAVAALSGPFLARPHTFANDMITYLRDYLRRAEAVGVEPDNALLASIIEALQPILSERVAVMGPSANDGRT